MLTYDFDYYLPDTLKEATDIYASVSIAGRKPYYYGGGTEIISMARVNNIRPDAVIDIKNIPECRGFGTDGQRLFLGSAVTLNEISRSDIFPLLGLAAGRIADHTIQGKITLGGNLAGTVYYHETMPPFMVCDSLITIASPGGSLRELPINSVLNEGKGLKPGELIVSISLDKGYTAMPYSHIKKVKIEKIGYPLISVSSVYCQGIVRLAVSGLCTYPVRLEDIFLSDNNTISELAAKSAGSITKPVIDDTSGSAQYRKFILVKTIEKILQSYKTR